MILELYSIYDKKLGEFLPPFCCKNEADAVRMCSNLTNNSDSLMLKFPEDYTCEKIGEFDSCSGQVSASVDSNPFEFVSLVKDETIKYKDILNKVDSMLTQASWFIKAAPEKYAEIDKYVNLSKVKYEELNNLSNKSIDVSVECPDFLPTNNKKSKTSFLDKLFLSSY